MPSITVWKCSGGSANSRTIGFKRERDRMLRRPVERARDLLAPPRELRARDGRIRHLVDDVVDLAAERVERGDRAAPRRRQEHEAVVEARAALRRLLLAVLVGCHAAALREGTSAWYATAHQSRARSTGRRANTSPSTASMRARMRRPPSITADSSRPRRHGSARASGRPATSSARARAVSNAASARQRVVGPLRGDLRLGDAEARQVFRRHVHAVLPPVDRHVLPEVGQLQARADGVARAHVGGRVRAVQREQDAAHRIGRAPAVVGQVVVGRVAADGDVLPERRHEVVERGERQRVLPDRGGQRRKRRRVGRPPGRDLVERRVVGGKGGEPLRRRRVALVGDVVRRAGEPVDRHDRGAQARRHKPGRHGKVFVMADGH